MGEEGHLGLSRQAHHGAAHGAGRAGDEQAPLSHSPGTLLRSTDERRKFPAEAAPSEGGLIPNGNLAPRAAAGVVDASSTYRCLESALRSREMFHRPRRKHATGVATYRP